MTANGKGRRHKGDRDAFLAQPARPLGDVIRQKAQEAGMTYGDYIVTIVARELGMPEYTPAHLDRLREARIDAA